MMLGSDGAGCIIVLDCFEGEMWNGVIGTRDGDRQLIFGVSTGVRYLAATGPEPLFAGDGLRSGLGRGSSSRPIDLL